MSALIYAALAMAQAEASAVGKRSRNEHHRYSYASSEDVIAEASGALSACGLAFVCVSAHCEALCESESTDGDGVIRRATQWQVRCMYLLVHSSGESLEVSSSTPILPEKGRPLDKALATAKTYDLAYTLRSLLLLPRLDPREIAEEPVDQRRETPAPVPGGSEHERIIANLVACTSHAELDDLMRRASVAFRGLDQNDPVRVKARAAFEAAKARVALWTCAMCAKVGKKKTRVPASYGRRIVSRGQARKYWYPLAQASTSPPTPKAKHIAIGMPETEKSSGLKRGNPCRASIGCRYEGQR